MDTRAVASCPGGERAGVGVQTLERGQQGRMDIEHAPKIVGDGFRFQNPHIARQHDQTGSEGVDQFRRRASYSARPAKTL